MVGGRSYLFYRQSYIRSITEKERRKPSSLASVGFPLHQSVLRRLRVIILYELGHLCKGLSCDDVGRLPERVAACGMPALCG